LGIPVTAELLAFHANVHTALANQLVEHWPHYLPGNWVPHCTLAEGLGTTQASAAFGLIYEYEPITVAVESVGIKDTASGAISEVFSATLRDHLVRKSDLSRACL
jgi:hypothetical protein